MTYTIQPLYLSQSQKVVINDDFQAASQNILKLIKSNSDTHTYKDKRKYTKCPIFTDTIPHSMVDGANRFPYIKIVNNKMAREHAIENIQ